MGINMAEVLIVNGIGICLMAAIQLIRIDMGDRGLLSNKIYDAMVKLTIIGCSAEIGTFLVDGAGFAGAAALSYLLNSICFLGTCSVGLLWCCYVEFKIYNSIERLKKRLRVLVIPFAIILVLIIANLFVHGIIFSISEENIYSRGTLVSLSYIALFIYFFYSILITVVSKRSEFQFRFKPVMSIYVFVVPCIAGTIIQGLFYGITCGWTSVAMSMTFVFIEGQSKTSFVDALSGMYNRRYLEYILNKNDSCDAGIYGIMLDVNGFKQINDIYGHTKGDEAIVVVGRMLSDVIGEKGVVIRFAGDEFIVLVEADNESQIDAALEAIKARANEISNSEDVPYSISFAVGTSRYKGEADDIDDFITRMDQMMYRDKEEYYKHREQNR